MKNNYYHQSAQDVRSTYPVQGSELFLSPTPPTPPSTLPELSSLSSTENNILSPSPSIQEPATVQKKTKARPNYALSGSIEMNSLRFFMNGVIRFVFRADNIPGPVSCVVFGAKASASSEELFSLKKQLAIKGFYRHNEWTDKNGHLHVDTDFVVRDLQEAKSV